MHAFAENESRETLIEKGPLIHIRRVATADAPGIHAIIRHSIEQPLSTASLDSVPPLAKIENTLISLEKTPDYLYSVAVDAGSRSILGLVTLGPFTARPSGPRSCFDRTASLEVATAGEHITGPDLDRDIKGALIDHAISACRTGAQDFRTIVVSTLARRNEAYISQDKHEVFLDRGFELAGTLQEVAEKDGILFDQVFFQYKV